MKKNYIVANWKMNLSLIESEKLTKELKKTLNLNSNIEVVLAPQFPSISCISKIIEQSPISLSAQDTAGKLSGAYTGEVSPGLLKELGCQYCIIGHSERRTIFKETIAEIAQKFSLLQEQKIKPILCIGENLQGRENNQLEVVLTNQLKFVLENEPTEDFLLAYEPVWAIGTGLTANIEQITATHNFIFKLLKEKFGETKANQIPILYGGSVKSTNSQSILKISNVTGLLIGGASLIATELVKIVNNS